jgi:hypothetical protein
VRGALLGIVFVELLFTVRNDFIAVPAHVGIAVILVMAVRFVSRYYRRHERPGVQTAPESPRPGGGNWQATPRPVPPRPAWGQRRTGE